jgi:hypothetical protein
MNPTSEQSDAAAKFKEGGALKINAFAGTGKTTTLRLLADSTSRRGMYLAFNKSIAADAKSRFPANVTCSTVHSIAFRATSTAFRRGDKMTGSMNANAVAKHLDYRDAHVDGIRLTARSQGHLTLETLRKFLQRRWRRRTDGTCRSKASCRRWTKRASRPYGRPPSMTPCASGTG